MKKGLSSSSQQLQFQAQSLSGPIVANSLNEDFSSSFSESSETESQRDVGARGDFVGFKWKKTRDFGDFVTFSNSPSQL